jgi:hypothetical protein
MVHVMALTASVTFRAVALHRRATIGMLASPAIARRATS